MDMEMKRYKRLLLFFLLTCILPLLAGATGWASPAPYGYPIKNKFAATIIGTPVEFRAQLPRKIRTKTYELTVFSDRVTPDVLWYEQGLRYSLAYQRQRAPLIFVIAGTGAGYNSPKMITLQKMFFKAGYHVIALPSSTNPNFVATASSSMVPGNLESDSQDLYRAMELAWQQVRDCIEVSDFYLTGYSLGAAQAAFVGKLDDEKHLFNFKKILMINPPVSLYNSVTILDNMLEKNIPGGLDKFNEFFDSVFRGFSEVYREHDFINFNNEFLYAAYRDKNPTNERMAAIIGFSFRISSANMVFASDVMANSGFIVPKNVHLYRTSSLTDYAKVTFRVSFLDYFHELVVPFFKAKDPGVTEQTLIASLSLKSIEDYLRKSKKIGLVTNEDDLILAPGEVDYFRQVFGDRAKIYPTGGHCGNIDYKENVDYMIGFFSNSDEDSR